MHALNIIYNKAQKANPGLISVVTGDQLVYVPEKSYIDDSFNNFAWMFGPLHIEQNFTCFGIDCSYEEIAICPSSHLNSPFNLC